MFYILYNSIFVISYLLDLKAIISLLVIISRNYKEFSMNKSLKLFPKCVIIFLIKFGGIKYEHIN